MPPKKGTSTPNKPPDNPTWTLDEGEEMRRDINELQKKMDSMEAKLDTKMDSMEAKLDTKDGWFKRGDHGSIEKFRNREDT
jgi:hypothetical protein